jgi:phosphopantothenoylcysteine decarboxylase / phosphopantothenate---cysteine ligase
MAVLTMGSYFMGMANKNIVLGVTGGIAAYKTPDLVRRLVEQGAVVRVVMTEAAKAFVTPLSLQAVSGAPVLSELLDSNSEAAMGHIELARFADLVLIAPATANILAKMASGQADDLLSTIVLATIAKVVVVPAMNQQMWLHQQTQRNIARLQKNGVSIMPPGDGAQACGEFGPGRMPEPLDIVRYSEQLFESSALARQHIMITAGPTCEAIDPVRFISNYSSGKMGFALARAAVAVGAEVTLIAGPVQLETPAHVKRMNVTSAQQMLEAVMQSIDEQAIFISCAAVSDYRVANSATHKLKKSSKPLTLQLQPTIDIVQSVARLPSKPLTVGFAAQTHDLEKLAREKMARKNLDMVIANEVGGAQGGFNADDNACFVVHKHGEKNYPLMSKDRLAAALMDDIACLLDKTAT